MLLNINFMSGTKRTLLKVMRQRETARVEVGLKHDRPHDPVALSRR